MPLYDLTHRTIYDNPIGAALRLPYGPSLQLIHPNGNFPIVHDPNIRQQSHIMGMFVLRPFCESWTQNILQADGDFSFYSVEGGWSYNIEGNTLDGYRLALQYGLSDAVIMSSRIMSTEGCDSYDVTSGVLNRGYLAQSYDVCQWSNVHNADENLFEKINETRRLWQEMGYLSSRKYPATIIMTWSGDHQADKNDFLKARIFQEKHPCGDDMEVYIVTSKMGGENIRNRASKFNLQDRIDDMIIELSPDDNPHEIELKALPSLLFQRFNMKIINNDGGREILRRFFKSKVLAQINLTLCRQKSQIEILEEMKSCGSASEILIDSILQSIDVANQNFFSLDKSSSEDNSDTCRDSSSIKNGKLPRTLSPIQIIEDSYQELAVVAFNSEHCHDL